jgi:glutaredoxin
MTRVTLYSKPDCSLCDEAREVIERVRDRYGFELEEVDITGDAALTARYGEQVPVVHVDGRQAFELRVDEAELSRRVAQLDDALT